MDDAITSGGLRLGAHLARPAGGGRVPGLVLCHGFPSGPRGSVTSGATFPELADRIAREAGWAVLTFNFRGTGSSEGDFSIAGWRADQRAAVDTLWARDDISGVWIAGTNLGGSLAVRTGADDDRVRGVAVLAAPVNLREWTRDPARFLEHARAMGVVRSPGFPPDVNAWVRGFAELDPLGAARRLAPRPLLVLHGTDDDVVPVADARALAEAGAPASELRLVHAASHRLRARRLVPRPLLVLHGTDDDVVPVADARALAEAGAPASELRLVHAASHRLRHDPRAVAALLGWLDRQIT